MMMCGVLRVHAVLEIHQLNLSELSLDSFNMHTISKGTVGLLGVYCALHVVVGLHRAHGNLALIVGTQVVVLLRGDGRQWLCWRGGGSCPSSAQLVHNTDIRLWARGRQFAASVDWWMREELAKKVRTAMKQSLCAYLSLGAWRVHLALGRRKARAQLGQVLLVGTVVI